MEANAQIHRSPEAFDRERQYYMKEEWHNVIADCFESGHPERAGCFAYYVGEYCLYDIEPGPEFDELFPYLWRLIEKGADSSIRKRASYYAAEEDKREKVLLAYAAAIRARGKTTGKAIAKALGVSPGTLSRWVDKIPGVREDIERLKAGKDVDGLLSAGGGGSDTVTGSTAGGWVDKELAELNAANDEDMDIADMERVAAEIDANGGQLPDDTIFFPQKREKEYDFYDELDKFIVEVNS